MSSLFHLGFLGHVDSGKTSLVRSLCTVSSTSSLDRSPDSESRGMTLDLGFGLLRIDSVEYQKQKQGQNSKQEEIKENEKMRENEKNEKMRENEKMIQFTLVDCPGHASLIRTVVGGVQIMDVVALVVDAGKGMQSQTAECLVLAECLEVDLIVVLNKVDLLGGNESEGGKKAVEEERKRKIEIMKKRIRKTFEKTRFTSDVQIVCVSAKEGEVNVVELIEALKNYGQKKVLKRRVDAPLLMAIDHCFPMKGHGSIITGTVLTGSVQVGDTVEIISELSKYEKKVKSIQCFHEPVNKCTAGDRMAFSVTQFDSKLLERGWVCSPNSVWFFWVYAKHVAFFYEVLHRKSEFH